MKITIPPTRKIILGLGVLLCIAMLLVFKTAVAYMSVVVCLYGDGAKNPFDFYKVPSSEIKTTLSGVGIKQNLLTDEYISDFLVFSTGQNTGDIAGTHLPLVNATIINRNAGGDTVKTLAHEYVHHLLSTRKEIRESLYGKLLERIKPYPFMSKVMNFSGTGMDYANMTSTARMENIPIYTWLPIISWRSVLEDGGVYEGYEGKNFYEYVLQGDYSNPSSGTDLLLQEIFTFCVNDVVLGVATTKDGVCLDTKETFFEKIGN